MSGQRIRKFIEALSLNDSMKLQILFPPLSIAEYVSHIFVIEDCNLHIDTGLPLLANGYPSISFQVTDGGTVILGGEKMQHLVLNGQSIQPAKLYTPGQLTMITYFLFPHAIKSFFGFDANELTDLNIDLNDLQPAREMGLVDRLLNDHSLEMRLKLLNDYVSRLMLNSRTDINKAILFAAEIIRKNRGQVQLDHIHREVHSTERTFRRAFEYHVGVSPKMYCRICQFDAAFRQLNQGRFYKLSDIAYQNGYADQSHLIRAFREFTNVTPREYLKSVEDFQQLNP